MQQYVNMTINGAKVRAEKNATVLDTALAYGVCIPHLCHMPNYTGFGGCRLCIVEVVKHGRAKVTASCTLDVQEGMVVVTHSEKLLGLRRNIAELLVAEAPNSKAMQCMATRTGVREVRYPFRRNDCVLCGRCVRVCGEMWQANAIGFVGRGKDRRVDFPFGTKPTSCKMCLSCVDVCPMTITPCDGPMKPGEEHFCGKCQSQLLATEEMPGFCVQCELGSGFFCTRATP
ncbi:MAG: (2Fe-2S)-binding protein [Planctomycetes bacterium]|nr:(2Fe-2S)-binding protein [Planctomycetota bacterium]